MNKQDWNDYAVYLRGTVDTTKLATPSSIGEALNNFIVMQDLEDVMGNKLGIKTNRDVKQKA